MSEGKDKTFEIIGKTIAAVDALTAAVQYSEHAWHWKKLQSYAEGLFARAPFKVGDRVRLTETPDINPKTSWGWMSAKHYLVKGALATVRSVDFSDGQFNALCEFDDETWKDDKGVLHPKDRPSLFHFWETKLERVDGPKVCECGHGPDDHDALYDGECIFGAHGYTCPCKAFAQRTTSARKTGDDHG